jgi:hypothetical protein
MSWFHVQDQRTLELHFTDDEMTQGAAFNLYTDRP